VLLYAQCMLLIILPFPKET